MAATCLLACSKRQFFCGWCFCSPVWSDFKWLQGLIDQTICSVKARFRFSPVKNPVIAKKGNRLIRNLRLIHHWCDSTSTVGTSGDPSLCLTSCHIFSSHFWPISRTLIPHSFKLHISQSPLTTQSYRTSSVGNALPSFLTSLSFSTPSPPTPTPGHQLHTYSTYSPPPNPSP